MNAFTSWTTPGHRSEHTKITKGPLPLAFEGWRNFKEAFSPGLVARAIEESVIPVGHCVDPFGGSGTTALACQFLGVNSTTIEVNPFLADLTEAKLATYDIDELVSAYARLASSLQKPMKVPHRIFEGAPNTFVEPGVGGRFLFSRKIAKRLRNYRDVIDDLASLRVQRLFKVVLGAISTDISNVTVSGKGRRYRSGWQDRTVSEASVDLAFKNKLCAVLYDVQRFQSRPCLDYRLLRGDARNLIEEVEPCDLAVFSPPYPNSFDYTDIYNVELWVTGYLRSKKADRALRDSTLRSHVQIARDLSSRSLKSKLLRKITRQLSQSRDKLWNRHIPEMVHAYFDDLSYVLEALVAKVRHRGRFYIVIGDSQYAGTRIPVAQILCELAPKCGLNVVRQEAFRSMRSSPQQGGQFQLSETLVVLERN